MSKEIALIFKMNSWELLEYVISCPEYLTDSYYKDFCNAIVQRFYELKEIRSA